MLTSLTLAAALVGHAALWVGLVNRSHAIGLPKKLKDGFTAGCGALLFGLPLLAAWRLCSLDEDASARLLGFADPLSTYFSICLPIAGYVAFAWLARRIGTSARNIITSHTQRTVDLGKGRGVKQLAAPGVTRMLASLPGNELLKLTVEEKTLCVPRLPAGLDGLKIAHLSDLHMSGRLAPEYYARSVDITNDWAPDLIALTGDLVENVATLDTIESTLGRLRAERGIYFVLGNHDAHGDPAELRRRLTTHGHTDLGGRWLDIPVGGVTLRLAGNELPWFGPAADLATAPDTADATFALVHSPDRIGWARRYGASLVLAGHNHGGQIRFPLIGPVVTPSLYGVRYASGVFHCSSGRHSEAVMHVTRGTGTLAPLRWNCPPELSLLTLTTG